MGNRLTMWGVLLALAATAMADQVVLSDGRVYSGLITTENETRLSIQVSGTIRVDVRRSEVARIVREEPQPGRPPTPGLTQLPPPGSPGIQEDAAKAPLVCFVQIQGPLETMLLPQVLRQACRRARQQGANVLVFEVDTPGGRLEVMQEILALVEELQGMRTVAYISGGPNGGAFSAGALVAAACQTVFMAPGTAIGAAAPVQVTPAGVAPASDKIVSAITAKARSMAERNGHPGDLVAAMVDADIELRTAKVDGREILLSLRPGVEPAAPAKKIELGDWVSPRGKLLTLTAREATRLGLAAALADSRGDILGALGLSDARGVDLQTRQALAEALARRDREILEVDARMASYEAKARAMDPAKFLYPREAKKHGFREKDDFLDEGQAWRARADICVRLADQCLDACREKLRMARTYPELGINTTPLETKMADLLALRERVLADRGRRGCER
jgi:ATP-dependent protease ClpP protease subunit